MKIYVVFGSTGEYSDHDEWMVKAFTKEAMAKDWIVKCTKKANELKIQYSNEYDIPRGANQYDPYMRIDYTGVDYNYSEVELLGTFEEGNEIPEEENDGGRRIILE